MKILLRTPFCYGAPPSIRRCCRAGRTVSCANDVLRFNFSHVFYKFHCMLGFVIMSFTATANLNGAYVLVNYRRNGNPFDISIETLFRNSLFRCTVPKAHKLRKLCFDIDLLFTVVAFVVVVLLLLAIAHGNLPFRSLNKLDSIRP